MVTVMGMVVVGAYSVRSSVWLQVCLVMDSSKDQLDQSFISLEISKIMRDRRLDCGCSL